MLLAKILSKSKLELNLHLDAQKVVGRDESFEHLDLPPCPRNKKIMFQRNLRKSWKNYIRRPLNFEEQERIQNEVEA